MPLEALARLDEVLRRMKRRPKRGAPASQAAIVALERAWGITLPPSYRTLLERHDGYSDRAKDPTIIGLAPLKELVPPTRFTREAAEWQHADPDCAEANRGLVIGRLLDGWILLDPAARRGDELGVVTVDSEMEVETYADLPTYLAARADAASAEAESTAFAKASYVRAKENEAAGAVIEELRAAAVSPDGTLIAGLSGGAIVFFDLTRAAAKNGALHAPYLHRVEGTMPSDRATDRLAFASDGAAVTRTNAAGTEVFEVVFEPRGPAPALPAFTIANRFRVRDGVRLTTK